MKYCKRILDFLIEKEYIDLKDFYAVTIYENELNLQGKLTSINIKKYCPQGRVGSSGDINQDYYVGKGKIKIVLL